jgi:hypothetical protein
MTQQTSTSKAPELSAVTGRKDRRRRRKMGAMPRPILPMRALWEGASREAQERAHQSAVWMLEYWLGRMSKAELAEHLGVTPLRVWQLSQLAIAGMVCGLLPQPRYRRGMRMMSEDPENDPKALLKENAQLRRELEVAQQLIDILKTLPGNAGRELETPAERPASGGRARGASSSRSGNSTRGRGDRGASSEGASEDGAAVDEGTSQTPGPSSD